MHENETVNLRSILLRPGAGRAATYLSSLDYAWAVRPQCVPRRAEWRHIPRASKAGWPHLGNVRDAGRAFPTWPNASCAS